MIDSWVHRPSALLLNNVVYQALRSDPTDSVWAAYLYLFFFASLDMQWGYFFTASFVRLLSLSPFYQWRSDKFFCQRDRDVSF